MKNKGFFCTLYSSSKGNCSVLRTHNTTILIDAGKPAKSIYESLSQTNIQNIDAIVVTHEHVDHTRGIGVISRKYNIPVYATQGTWDGMKDTIKKIDNSNIKIIKPNEEFVIGDVQVKAFSISHDANEPVGYNFFVEDKKITTATDIGCVTEELVNSISDSDILLLESNHDVNMVKYCKRPWSVKQRILGEQGHLCNEVAGELLVNIYNNRLKSVILGHLSKDNNYPELAYKAVRNILQSRGIELELAVAGEDTVSKKILF